MKKYSLRSVALALSIAIGSTAFSQSALPFKVDIGKFNDEFNVSDNTTTNSRVMNSFNKMFAGATNVKWTTDNRNNARVYFEAKGKATRAVFNSKGQLLYSISTYGEELLPNDVLMQVKRAFFGRSIFGVTEVSALGKSAYLIVLQDKTTWLHIKVLDGEIEEGNMYRRAD